MDREWTDEVAEKSARMSAVWAMLWVKLVNFVNFVMPFLKWTKWTKWTAQIFVESAESAKSAKSIFATFATFANANFVGKASCESTMRYRERSRIPSCCLRSASVPPSFRLRLHPLRMVATLLLILCFGVGNVWGLTETITLSDFGWSNASTQSSITATTATIALAKNSGSTTPTYYTADGLRIYGVANKTTGGTISFTPKTGITISSIAFSHSAKNSGVLSIKSGGGSYSSKTWTGTLAAGSTVTLVATNSGPNAPQVRITEIEITYTAAASKTLSSIAITNAPTTTKYLVGETFSKTGAVVTATYSDKTTANVSASATWTPTTGLVAGSNTITASYTEGGVTKTATTTVTAYSVTVQKQDEDGTTIDDAGVSASATGRTLSASGGSTNYVFKQWKFGTASGTSIASSSSASTSLTGTPTAAVTVIAEFYKPITITYKANGSIFTTQTYARGGTLAFPASKPDGATYSCTGKTFVGWVGETNKDYSHATTAPTYASAGGSVTAAANYYAVFADATPSTNYKQITAEGDLVAGARYLIVGYSSSTYKALPVDDATSLTTVTVSSSTISNPGSTLIWTLEGSADAWKIKSTNNNKYLQISGGNLTFEVSTTLTFSVGVSLSVFTFTSSASSGNKVLSYYADKNKFNAFSSANTVYVYKQVINATNFATTCATTYDVTRAGTPAGTVTGGTFTVSPNRQAAGKTVNLSPTPDLGYSFGSWTVTKTETPYTDITSTNVAGNTLTMPAFDVTVNATFTPTPELTATGGDLSSTTLPFGTSCEQDEGTDKTFVLNGYSLTNDVTLTISGTDASMFSVKSPSSPIDKGTGRITDQTVTVTFTPTSTGTKTATLTIASSGASSVVLTLSGTAVKHYQVHYWNSGTDVHQESVLAGTDASATWDGVDDEDGCDTETYKYFVGWSKTNVGSTPTTTKPTIGETYTSVSSDVHYYAVWTNVNPAGWERYESSTLAEGDYLIVQYYGSNYIVMKNSVTSNRMDYGVGTYSAGLITRPTSADGYDWNDYIWHIAESSTSGYYTIYNADESKYVVSNAKASQIELVASPADGKDLFSFTYNSTNKTYEWTNKYNTDNEVKNNKSKLANIFRHSGSGFACYASDSHTQYLFYRAGGTAQYITNCCDKNVTLSDPTITDAAGSGATITFDKSSPVATCGGETTVTATLTLPAGYEATALSFSGGSVSVSPEISLPVTATTVYTLTFDANTNATLTTTATVAAKTANAWNWTYNGGAIPDPLVLYVGINKQLDVTYTPADLLNTQKNYTVTKTDAHVSQGGKAYDYYTMRGAPSVTTETNSTVTFSLNGLSQTVNVTVKPQPRVHFVDIVHGESFADVGPAVESYVATFIQPTPTHSDVSDPGENYNSCERGHLHLIGWIRSDYSKVEDYLDGTGAKPSITELTDAGTDGEGLSYYFETNADINVEAYNGLTFYAVWAKVE